MAVTMSPKQTPLLVAGLFIVAAAVYILYIIVPRTPFPRSFYLAVMALLAMSIGFSAIANTVFRPKN